MPDTALILGCGFTGTRVALALLAHGADVTCTSRHPERLQRLAALGAKIVPLDATGPTSLAALRQQVPQGCRVLHSIPSIHGPSGTYESTHQILEALGNRPFRLVYLSTTGVYGATSEVDERTPASPETPRQKLRREAEQAVEALPYSSLILRSAAIYGPWRGVHASMRQGIYKLVDGGRKFISRIHVDDLAALCVAALEAEITGAYPVADLEPAPARDVAEFCSKLLGIPMPPSAPPAEASETLRFDRRVNSEAIRDTLGIKLRYPTYREGIPAALREEADGNPPERVRSRTQPR